jgi:nicotinate-nucleotide pyrophosphorylase (carboxylating)
LNRDDLEPPALAVREAVTRALAEDLLPLGDLTAGLVPADLDGRAAFVARQEGVIAGTACASEAFVQVDQHLDVEWELSDGDPVSPGGVIGRVGGRLRSILTAERTALNFLCHLSGVATSANRFCAAAAGGDPRAVVWDTRKTTPGLRALEKAAVRAGGAANHRGSLSEAVLVKDNHLAGLSIAEAVGLARRRWPGRMLEVECDRIEQVAEALEAGASLLLCDNMTPAEVESCVRLVRADARGVVGAVLVEASGRITLDNVACYAAAGADVISVGAITHSAPVLDIGLDIDKTGDRSC